MFSRLQSKWKVGTGRLILIIATFAIGGSLTGLAGRNLMKWAGFQPSVFFFLPYIVVITLLWPLSVLLVSIPLGQFAFFRNYLARIALRMSGRKLAGETVTPPQNTPAPIMNEEATFSVRDQKAGSPTPVRLALFASGAGSNAARIIRYFQDNALVKVTLIVCNKPGAGVLDIARLAGIETLMMEKENFFRGDACLGELKKHQINFIVLAGFLWKIPSKLIAAFPNRIINIHPALLPAYGGKGMYGQHVHEAVIAAGDVESGITIHFVDEQYDHGSTIAQFRCPVMPGDTAATLAARVHQLEHQYFPGVIAAALEKAFGLQLPKPIE